MKIKRLIKHFAPLTFAIFIPLIFYLDVGAEIKSFQDIFMQMAKTDFLYIALSGIILSALLHKQKTDSRLNKILIVISTLFAILLFIGKNLSVSNKLILYALNFPYLIYIILILVSYVALFYHALFCFYLLLEKIEISKYKEIVFINKPKQMFVILVTGRLLFLLAYYPGTASYDTFIQFAQGLDVLPLSNHHPVFLSVFFGTILKIGNAIFGDYASGVFVIGIIQILFFSFVLVKGMQYLKSRGISNRIRLFVFMFYLVVPLCSYYSITIWKDVWLANFLFLFCIQYDKIMNKADYFGNRINFIKFILISLGVIYSKNTGIYVVILSLLISIIYFAKKKRDYKLHVTIMAVIILFYVCINGPIMNAMGVTQGRKTEALSAFLQPYARLVSYHENELSDDELLSISKVLPIDKVSELYNPRISDSIKDNATIEGMDMHTIFDWIKIGSRYPDVFISAFLNNNFGYWYPESYPAYESNRYIDGAPIDFDPSMATYNKEIMMPLKSIVDSISNIFMQIPILNMLNKIGSYTWILIALSGYAVYKNRFSKLYIMIPISIVFLTALASPLYSEFRYAYPIALLAPLLFGLYLGND